MIEMLTIYILKSFDYYFSYSSREVKSRLCNALDASRDDSGGLLSCAVSTLLLGVAPA